MTDRHLRPVQARNVPIPRGYEQSVDGRSTDDFARRSLLLASIGQLADHEPPLVDSDDLRLALLSERVGEVGAAYWRGMNAIEDELQKVAATALAWLEQIMRERAR